MRHKALAITVWLLGLAACLVIIGRSNFSADMSAFLPASPTEEQQVLIDQLKDGVVSRLILVGIEGSDADTRTGISRSVAETLRTSADFVWVGNGESQHDERDQAFVFDNRYLLSSAVTPEHFSVEGLEAAIGDTIDLLASPAGMMIKSILPRDPTGEIVHLLDQLTGGNQPSTHQGVWVSRDANRALLLLQTRASGSDLDAQQKAIAQLEQAFAASVVKHGEMAADARLLMTGPGIFAVQSRSTIQEEIGSLVVISTSLIILLLLLIYRSLPVLVLGLIPMLSGAVVAVAAVSMGFGIVHGVTLGFGSALIGEAVDYAIYLFVQSQKRGDGDSSDWLRESWPAIRLGVLTSILGFSILLFSDFPGLAQLGLYAIAGITTAALVTRHVLPHLLPANFSIRDVSPLGRRLVRLQQLSAVLRWPVIVLTIVSAVVVWQHRDSLWNSELSSLSPVSESAQQLDSSLRADMGAPDVRYMVIVSGPDQQSVLQAAEKVAEPLQDLVEQGVLAGFQSPAQFLPSDASQKARQAALTVPDMNQRLQQAVSALPVRAEVLAPFVEDIKRNQQRATLTRADLEGTSFALLVDSLLLKRDGKWSAVLPLMVPQQSAELDSNVVRAAIAEAGQGDVLFVDLKKESDNLYDGYLNEAIVLSGIGMIGIVLLLMFALRSLRKAVLVMLPLLSASLMVVATLVIAGQQLIILHLVGLLLTFAVGSNYALLFGQEQEEETLPRTYASLLFANLTTAVGFGILACSSVPVLNAIGITVGPGLVLSLIFCAAFSDILRGKR